MIFFIFSLAFGILSVLHVPWIQNSNFMHFVVIVLIKGETEKPSGQYLNFIMMSNRFLSSVSHVFLPTLIRVSAVIPNLVPRTSSSSVAMLSWPGWKRSASSWVWDIDQVPLRNFDWLSFTPPLVASSDPSIGIRDDLLSHLSLSAFVLELGFLCSRSTSAPQSTVCTRWSWIFFPVDILYAQQERSRFRFPTVRFRGAESSVPASLCRSWFPLQIGLRWCARTESWCPPPGRYPFLGPFKFLPPLSLSESACPRVMPLVSIPAAADC
jgi:hypothetical protein